MKFDHLARKPCLFLLFYMQTIIDNINTAMKQKGWNPNRLARESGGPQPAMSRFLNREPEEIKTKIIRQIG